MFCGYPCLPDPPWRCQEVLPKAQSRWWLLLDGNYTLLVETSAQDEHLPLQLFKLGDLYEDPLTPIYLGHLQVLLSGDTAPFYRPLKACLPALPDFQVTSDQILQAYDIDVTALAAMHAKYDVSPLHLYRRLLDLALALRYVLDLGEKSLVHLLQWHSSSRRTAAAWPTPLAAILNGAPAQVETALYPHPADGGWA